MRVLSFDKKNSQKLTPAQATGRNSCLVPYQNKIYKFGGTSSLGTTAPCSSFAEVYDIQSETWSTITSVPGSTGVRSAGGFEHDGYIYIYGGFNGSSTITVSGTLYRYDPATNSYATMSSGSARAGSVNGKLFIGGKWYFYSLFGYSTTTSVSTTAQRYDISLDSWSTISVTNANYVAGGASVVYDNKIYSFLNTSISGSTECYVFDPSTNFMRTISSPTFISNNSSFMSINTSASVVGDNIYLFNRDRVYRYNPALDSWHRVNDCMQHRLGSSVTTVAGKLYSIGGFDIRNLATGMNESYTPDSPEIQSETLIQITDFSAGTTFSENGLNVVNSSNNRWIIGTGGGVGTTGNSAYIAPAGSTTKGYNPNLASVSHFYFDYAIPSIYGASSDLVSRQTTAIQLIFGMTLSVDSDYNFDYFSVAITNTSTVPVSNVDFTSGRVFTTKRTWVTPTYFGYQFINLTQYQGQTVRIVFTWLNDDSIGPSNGGITIDDIKIKIIK